MKCNFFAPVINNLILNILQKMLLTSLMTPVLVAPRDKKEAQEKWVKNPGTLSRDSKRFSVAPKRYWNLLKLVLCFYQSFALG